MRAASAVSADPAESLLREFQDTLSARQDTLLTWRAADGSTHLAVLHDCGLALTKVSLGYKLTAIFMGGAPPGLAPESGQPPLIERGRRVLKHGSLVDLQELAVRLLRQGVRGGPSYDDGPLQWALVRTDGSLRMTVPGGELRVCPITQGNSVLDTPDTPCTLTFENRKRVYAIARDAGEKLQAEALEIWQQQKARHPLQIRLREKCVNLRSANMPGVLGYHAIAERTFIVLAWVEDELGLYYLDGRHSVCLTRLTLRDVRNGEPPDVDALLQACAREAANAGPSELVEPPANGPHDDVAEHATAGAGAHASAEDSISARPGPRIHSGLAPAPARAPMAQWQLDLCQRHLQRLYTRLRGRGARKARELVRRLHDAIDRCCRDITGSRSEVHGLLVEMLGTELAGGDRNIRDCLDLLARESPLFRRDGHRCSILLAQLHDPHSALIRRIAEEEARAAQGTSPPPDPPAPPPAPPKPGDPPAATTATTATATTPLMASTTLTPPAAVSPPQPMPQPTPTPTPMRQPQATPTTPPTTTAVASPTPSPASAPTPPAPPSSPPSAAPSTEPSWAPGLGPYRVLGADTHSTSTAAFSTSRATVPSTMPMPGPPGISSAFTPSPTAAITGLLHDDPDDPYDPELESLDAPSRWRLASRQKPPTPGDGGGTQGSS